MEPNKSHLQELIRRKQRQLQHLQLKEATMGINTPVDVLTQIEDLEADLTQLYAQLQAIPPAQKPPAAVDAPAGIDAKPTIFISYSHQDEAWKDRLMIHLQVLALEERFAVWDDRQITTGDDWYPAIERAVEQSSLAVLLVSVNFLTSRFILGEEIPRLLQRRAAAGLRVYPIIVSPCPWQRVEWLSRIQLRPKGGRPLASGSEYQIDETLAKIALEIDDLLRR